MKIPEGFTSLTPFLSCENTAEMINFYKKALNAQEIERIPLPNGGISYALIKIGNAHLMLGDIQPNCGTKSAKELGGIPVSFYVYVDDVDAAFEQAKNAGMSVTYPVQEQFWGDKMGALLDPFKLSWTLAEKVRNVSKEELLAGSQNMYSEQANTSEK